MELCFPTVGTVTKLIVAAVKADCVSVTELLLRHLPCHHSPAIDINAHYSSPMLTSMYINIDINIDININILKRSHFHTTIY